MTQILNNTCPVLDFPFFVTEWQGKKGIYTIIAKKKKKVLWQLCGDGNIGPLYAVSQHKNATNPPNNIHVSGQIPAITSCPSAVDLLRRCIAGRREAVSEDSGKWFVQLRSVTEVLGVVGLFFCSWVLVGASLCFSQGCCSSHPQCWGTTVRQRKAEDLVFPSDVFFLVLSLYSLIPSSTIVLGVEEEGRSWKENAEAVLDKCCQINPSLSKLFPWTVSLCLCSWHRVAKAYDRLSSQWLCVQRLYVSIDMNKVGLFISYWDLGFSPNMKPSSCLPLGGNRPMNFKKQWSKTSTVALIWLILF